MKIPWLLSGGALLAAVLGWMLLSDNFIYGQGHTDRPIGQFLILYALAWAGYFTAILWLFKLSHRPSLLFILGVAIAARLFLLPSNLIQENDVYRYVLDGQILLAGMNPYQFSPEELSRVDQQPVKSLLESEDARQVLSRISYREVPTVYPPAAQLVFAAGALAGGWNWKGQRWVFLGIELLLGIGLLLLLRSLDLRLEWVVAYAWNPLVLKEVANSVHLDVLVASSLVGVLLALQWFEETHRSGWLAAGGTCLALAGLAKIYPLILLPVCLFYLFRFGWHHQVIFFGSFAGTLVAGVLPFLGIGVAQVVRGLSTFAAEWQMNEGAFSVLALVLPQARITITLLIILVALIVPVLRQPGTVRDLAAGFHWILLLWFLMIPTPFPWYSLPLMALLAFYRDRAPFWATVVFSLTGSLYYLSFIYEYHSYPIWWWQWTRAVEHGLVWLSLAGILVLQFCGLRNRGLSSPV